jgi:hypothetical protein
MARKRIGTPTLTPMTHECSCGHPAIVGYVAQDGASYDDRGAGGGGDCTESGGEDEGDGGGPRRGRRLERSLSERWTTFRM